MIDPRHIGHTLPPYAVDVEKGRLKFFAKAIGQTDPVYTDEATAKAAGHPSLPVPPVDWPSALSVPVVGYGCVPNSKLLACQVPSLLVCQATA